MRGTEIFSLINYNPITYYPSPPHQHPHKRGGVGAERNVLLSVGLTDWNNQWGVKVNEEKEGTT